MRKTLLLLPLLILGACGREEPPPLPKPAGTAAAPSPTVAERAVMWIELGRNKIEMELPKFAADLTQEGRDFQFYRAARETVIREYMAQRYDEVAETWDIDKVKTDFDSRWGEMSRGMDQLRAEIEAQRLFTAEYLSDKAADSSLTAAKFWEKIKAEAPNATMPFQSSLEWERFTEQFPTMESIEALLASVPKTAEEAWQLHGAGVTAQVFGNEWVMNELKSLDESIEAKLSDPAVLSQAGAPQGGVAASFLPSSADARQAILTELRNRLALVRSLGEMKIADDRLDADFRQRAAQELDQPLPGALEAIAPALKPGSPAKTP